MGSRLALGAWANLSLLLLLGFTQQAGAWSEGGHIAIAEVAMQSLTTEERNFFDRIAQTLVVQNARTARLVKRYGAHSATALTAAWTDGIRGRTLEEIFAQYGQRIPVELAVYAKDTTDDWHYSNLPYFDEKGEAARFRAECPALNSGRLNLVLPLLQKSFISAEDPRDRAIVLAMLVHLVGDAHQPLHAVTRITDGCEHDLGGNRFCVAAQGSGDRCKRNLHRLWDAGFGLFYRRDFDVVLSALGDQRGLTVSAVGGGTSMRPETWQEENLAFADFIYSTMEGAKPDRSYREKGERIVRQRAQLAARRLAALLRELVRKEETIKSREPKDRSSKAG